jgi:hypothetical protein
LGDLSEGAGGEAEVIESRASLFLECWSATIAREIRKAEIVDDETKKFDGKEEDHREGGGTTV